MDDGVPEIRLQVILERLRERIVAFATSRGLGDSAEDVTQEVLMVLHEKYSEVTELTELVPLSFQILRYKMLDRHRKIIRRGEYNSEPVDQLSLRDPADGPLVQAEQKERVAKFIEVLQQLGERCRELFRLKLEGHSFPEIREILGERSINTIYTWDSRCRKQLLNLMGGKWEGEPERQSSLQSREEKNMRVRS